MPIPTGPNPAGWMADTNAARLKTITDALTARQDQQAQGFPVNNIDPGDVNQRIRDAANANFTDPSGLLALYTQSLVPSKTPNKPSPAGAPGSYPNTGM